MDIAKLKAELTIDEGRKPRIYIDTVGKSTGGVGRNLTDVPFSDDEIDLMLSNDIQKAVAALDRALPWWRNMSDVRMRVISNLCFNMGIGNSQKGLLSFKNTLAAMQAGDYKKAAQGMRDSTWATQTGQRAVRLAKMMEDG